MGRFLTRTLLVGLAALITACGGSKKDLPMSGVLITMDSTNTSALGAYMRREGLTPFLDQLASESLVFDQARTTAPLTVPAHASMLTGLYPNRHTVRNSGLRPLPDSALTLAEKAREAGFETAAFVSAIILGSGNGLDQGFDLYDEVVMRPTEQGIMIGDRTAAATTQKAIEWLKGRDHTRPFFLWVHYFDPMAPYSPDPQYMERVGQFRPRFPTYLGEVAQMDAGIGALLEALREEHAMDKLLVAAVSDHGESLFRHGEPTHSLFVYDATVKVPMMLRYPDGYRAGERSKEFVSVADVYPTFVSGLGLGEAGEIDGLNLFKTSVPADRGVYYESLFSFVDYGWSPLLGYTDARGTYIHGSSPELFLPADRIQDENVFAANAELAAAMKSSMQAILEQDPIASTYDDVDQDVLRKLREQGYEWPGVKTIGVPADSALGKLPHPKDRLEDLMAQSQGPVLMMQGKPAEAVAKFRENLVTNPNDLFTLEQLGALLYTQRQHQEVLDLFLPRLDLIQVRRACLGQLADSMLKLGQLEESLPIFLMIYQQWPDDTDTLDRLVQVLLQQGHTEEAQVILSHREALR